MPLGAFRINTLASAGGGEVPVRASDAILNDVNATLSSLEKFGTSAFRTNYYASSNSYIQIGNAVTGDGNIDDSNIICLEGWIGGSGDRGPFIGTTSFGANWLPQTNDFYIFSDSSDNWFFHRPGGTTYSISPEPSGSTTYYHWAIQYNGNGTSTAWWNGSRVWTNLSSAQTNRNRLYFGYGDYQNASYPGTKYILHDEIRITWGTPRYDSSNNLTVPTAAFVNDASTLALFHLESLSETDDSA